MNGCFGDILKDKIRKRGLSMPEFADRVGVAKSTVSKIQAGKMKPNVAFVAAWPSVLRLTESEILAFRYFAALAHVPSELRDALDKKPCN